MTASRWTRRLRAAPGAFAHRAGHLRAAERLAGVGIAIVAVSLFLPCYGAPVGDDLAATGFGEFTGFEAALALTAAAALWLILATGGGYDPPRPLSIGGMLIAAGVWAAAISAARLGFRPGFDLGSGLPSGNTYELRYGLLVALGGSIVIGLAGVRARRRDLARRARRDAADASASAAT